MDKSKIQNSKEKKQKKQYNPPTFLKVLRQNLPARTLSTAASSSDLVPTQRSGATAPDVLVANAAAAC